MQQKRTLSQVKKSANKTLVKINLKTDRVFGKKKWVTNGTTDRWTQQWQFFATKNNSNTVPVLPTLDVSLAVRKPLKVAAKLSVRSR